MPFTWSNQNQAPSEGGGENVLTFGDIRVTMKDGSREVGAAGVAPALSGNGQEMTSGVVRHDGSNIGATHTHGGVAPGTAETGHRGSKGRIGRPNADHFR